MKLTKRLRIKDERGFAALIIAIVLVIVLSLLTIGFAELMRHSQLQQLNRQLSDQAYYAAESGINDAVSALNAGYNSDKTNCAPITSASGQHTGWQYLSDPLVSKTSYNVGTSYPDDPQWTCLLITLNPSSLVYNPVDTTTPTTAIFQPVNSGGNAVGLNQIDIYWQDTDPTNQNFRNNSGTDSQAFPTNSNWNSIGMLRFSLTPLADMSRQGLVDNTFTAFPYPSTSNSNNSTAYVAGNGNWNQQGSILNGGCNAGNGPRYCHVTITGLGGTGNNGDEYLMSLRSIYSPTNVYITANNGTAFFSGAQSMIDSTGKSQNVLKRIQVRVPNRNSYPYPGFDVNSTGGICKLLNAYPGSGTLTMPCSNPPS